MNTPRRKVLNQQPVIPQGEVVADFKQYPDAVAFVQNLVRNDFPAGQIAIVGSDLRTVERIRAKLSYNRLAIAGATTGAWVGLAYALIFGGLNYTDQTSVLSGGISSVVVGAGLGILFNVVRFSLSRNKRNYISQSSVIANKYQVQVPTTLVDKARELSKLS